MDTIMVIKSQLHISSIIPFHPEAIDIMGFQETESL